MEVSVEATRIRLEGALELVEETARECRKLSALVRSKCWIAAPATFRNELDRVARLLSAAEPAATKVASVKRAEGWPKGFAASVALVELDAATSQLADTLERALKESGLEVPSALRDRVSELENTIAKPTGSQPLFRCRAQRRPGRSLILPAALGVGVCVSMAVLSLPTSAYWGLLAAYAIGGALTFWRLRARVELFGDRLRVVGRSDSWEAHRRWSFESDAAIVACDGRVHFLHSGAQSFDAVARVSRQWPVAPASILAWALLRLPRESREETFARLERERCLVRLGAAPEITVRARLATFGDVAGVTLNRKLRRELERWLAVARAG